MILRQTVFSDRSTLHDINIMAGIEESADLAKGYALVNNTQYNTGMFLIESLHIKPGTKVLDVGCGPGDITAQIADVVGPGGSVVGIDPSKERIVIALEKARPNLTFQQGKAEDLSSFQSATFDVVYVNSTFHWVQDQLLALQEFARVLKPGGRVGLSGGHGDFPGAHESIKAKVLSREPYRSYKELEPPTFLKKSELESLLDQAGFTQREMVIKKIHKSVKDAEAMMVWLETSSSGKCFGGIPLEMRPKAREEFVAEWDKCATKDGVVMEMEVLVTVAVKN